MRIAQVAPLYESVPPHYYGGTERVVSYLTEELVVQGQDVTLFASGDSKTSAHLIACSKNSLRLDKYCEDQLAYHVLLLEKVFQMAEEFDIIHFHTDYLHYPLSRRSATAHVTTLHGRLDIPDLVPLYQEFRDIPLVSISHDQRTPLPWVNWQATVYHGLPERLLTFRPEAGKYLAFLGRVSPEKRLDRAIKIAKRSGIELRIAAKVDKTDQKYFRETIKPLLNHPLIDYVGEITEAEKDDFLGNAYEFYVLATSPLIDVRTRVLKHGETFAVFDRYGDIQSVGLGEQGIYHEGTRFLSRSILTLGEDRPLLLSSTVQNDNALLTADLTNPDVYENDQVVLPRGTIHIFRAKLLWKGVCYERVRISNYGLVGVDITLSLQFESDFADIFEVRGVQRPEKGMRLAEIVDESSITYQYRGLDGVLRRTKIECTPKPALITYSGMRLDSSLPPHRETTFIISVSCDVDDSIPAALSYDSAFLEASEALCTRKMQACKIQTSNDQFNDCLNRSAVDLRMMTTDTENGPYPFAGVPWFSSPFGRDGIITALECLWFQPAIARGVLKFLAATQAREVNEEQDAQPGKILHETRKGEMAALSEIPFGRYYGSVDATPLFVLLAGDYYRRTADIDFIQSIWPNIEAALQWIDQYGDSDSDGFVEYYRMSANGLIQQGWKDSFDSVFHADGSFAQGSIALCEVQGYVYAAKKKAADLARTLGMERTAGKLAQQAQFLRKRFLNSFWCKEISSYALALDGDKRACRVMTSNAGQTLFTGIASPQHALAIAQRLFGDEMFSGWGIRTVASSEIRYNPMSYHNGSVWPHDNALIADGLARYGYKEMAAKIWTALFESSLFMDLYRLPELFCGFAKRHGEGPTLYPVACAPQSWAAASFFLLMQSCLGMSIDAVHSRISFDRPLLPDFIQKINIRELSVGESTVDLELERFEQDVGIKVLRRTGRVDVFTIK